MMDPNLPTLLIVDDVESNLFALEHVLSNMGTNILKAKNGKEALIQTFRHPIALVLLDIQMPELNGFEVLRLLRKRKRTAFLPVIFLTAMSKTDEVLKSGYQLGAVDFIFKPIQEEILTSKVKVFLDFWRQKTQLEKEVQKRHKAEADLLLAKNSAESANKAKSLFLANMSHEIRTPMNGIFGMISLLLESKLEASQLETAKIAYQSAENLLGIINEVLDLSKIDSGKMELEHLAFDLKEILNNLIDLQKSHLFKKGLEVSISYPPDLPTKFIGDPTKLRQVINNFFSNSIKFTDQGNIEIGVSISNLDSKHENRVKISVRDTGIGIPAEKLEVIWEEFSQADLTTTRKFGGTGLGLAISRKLASLMKGKVGVHSLESEGSEFWVELPLEPNYPGLADRETDPTIEPQGSQRSKMLTKAKVLVVDDNQINCKVAVKMLKSLNCESDVACNGLEAVDMVLKENYDLVLMDCHMPVLDGFRATSEIRKREGDKHNIIIALTADALEDIRQRCQDVGMDDFLTKPFFVKDFRSLLIRWVNWEPDEFESSSSGAKLIAS